LSLTANISETDKDSDKMQMALTRRILLALNKKIFVKFRLLLTKL